MQVLRHLVLVGCVSLCSASITACAAETAASPVVEKRPYVGTLDVRAHVRNGSPMRRSGRGGAEFQSLPSGRSRLVVYGDLGVSASSASQQSGDAGFAVEGAMRAGTWLASDDDLRFSIAPDGTVSGGGLVGSDRYAFSGNIRPDAFDLKVQITPAATSRANANGIESFVFDYTLRHQAQASTQTRSATRSPRVKGSCRTIRYEPRMIANIGGDTMSSVQVPVCVE